MYYFSNVFHFKFRNNPAKKWEFVQLFRLCDNRETQLLRHCGIIIGNEGDQFTKVSDSGLGKNYFEARLGIIFLTSSSDTTSPRSAASIPSRTAARNAN